MAPETLSAETPKIAYDDHGRRDPFVPLDSEKKKTYLSGLTGVESADDLHLEGVVVDPKSGSIAIVNGIVLTQGETNGDVKLIKITEEGATFEIKGRSHFKPLTTDQPTEVQ